MKDATLLFKLLDDMVEEIGEANLVQVIIDNAKNYKKAGMYDLNQYLFSIFVLTFDIFFVTLI